MSLTKLTNHFLSALAVALFVFIAFGSMDDDKKNTSTNISSESNDVIYKKIGDEVSIGNFTYRVNGVDFLKTIGSDFSSTTADGIFIIVNLSLVNNDNKEHTVDNSMFKLTDANGAQFESSIEGSTELEIGGNETLFLKQCNPQITKSGFLIFEVPVIAVYNLHLSGGLWSGKTAIVELSE